MTDRGLPVVDGAPACPFVAFADERDERATSPDHRHRCYAEARPAPRALAHQEAYCLASAFPVCPTFQDWARREAATARSEPGRPAPPPSAPPGVAGTAAFDGRASGGQDVSAPSFLASRDRPGGGLAGSAADRLASERAAAASQVEEGERDRPATPEPPTRPQGGGPTFAPGVGPTAAGLTGSAAPGGPGTAGMAGAPAVGGVGGVAGAGADVGAAAPGPPRDAGSWLDDEVERQDAAWDRSPAQGASRRPSRSRREPNPAPSYDRPRRESYPTRRTRTGIRGLSPLALAAIGILVLALLLFLAPGFLRNLGSGEPGASEVAGATGSPSAVASSSPSSSPSPTPAASTYVVQAGDTLSEIAQRFGVSLEALIAANEENLPDPNNLQIGDELIIPTGDESPAASGPSPSPLP